MAHLHLKVPTYLLNCSPSWPILILSATEYLLRHYGYHSTICPPWAFHKEISLAISGVGHPHGDELM